MIKENKYRGYKSYRKNNGRELDPYLIELYLKSVNTAYKDILNKHHEIGLDEISDVIGLNKEEKKDLNGYLNNKFDRAEVCRTTGFNRNKLKSKLLIKLKGFEEFLKLYKKVILLKPIDIWLSTSTENSKRRKITYKEGSIVVFKYHQKIAGLYVCDFGNGISFPLRENEFQWIVK